MVKSHDKHWVYRRQYSKRLGNGTVTRIDTYRTHHKRQLNWGSRCAAIRRSPLAVHLPNWCHYVVSAALQLIDAVLHVCNQIVPALDLNLQRLKLVVELPLDVPQMVLDELTYAQEHTAKVFLIFNGSCVKSGGKWGSIYIFILSLSFGHQQPITLKICSKCFIAWFALGG